MIESIDNLRFTVVALLTLSLVLGCDPVTNRNPELPGTGKRVTLRTTPILAGREPGAKEVDSFAAGTAVLVEDVKGEYSRIVTTKPGEWWVLTSNLGDDYEPLPYREVGAVEYSDFGNSRRATARVTVPPDESREILTRNLKAHVEELAKRERVTDAQVFAYLFTTLTPGWMRPRHLERGLSLS
jgi:hypothetical protein